MNQHKCRKLECFGCCVPIGVMVGVVAVVGVKGMVLVGSVVGTVGMLVVLGVVDMLDVCGW